MIQTRAFCNPMFPTSKTAKADWTIALVDDYSMTVPLSSLWTVSIYGLFNDDISRSQDHTSKDDTANTKLERMRKEKVVA